MQFDLVYEKLLAELFNTKQSSEWIFHDGAFHTILEGPNGITYMLNLASYWEMDLPAEAFNVKEMSPEQWKTLKHGTWHVEFGSEESKEQTEITGEQGMSSSKVFSLIGNALLNKVKEQPKVFKNLAFSAKEPSRRSLYARLAPLLAKKLNKDVVVSDDGSWFFIVAKPAERIIGNN